MATGSRRIIWVPRRRSGRLGAMVVLIPGMSGLIVKAGRSWLREKEEEEEKKGIVILVSCYLG